MPVRNIKKNLKGKGNPKKGGGLKRKSLGIKKGGSIKPVIRQSSCSTNAFNFGDSCISWMHLFVIIILIVLVLFVGYIYLEDRKQGIMFGELYSGNSNSNNNSNPGDNVSKYKHDVNININQQEPNHNRVSYVDQLHQKNHERIINPLLPPERSYVNTYGIPINVPSRGVSAGPQQVGILYKTAISDTGETIGNNSETNILPLFGTPIYPGSRKWNYYTTSDKYHTVKMPISKDGRKCDASYGCDEIYTGDELILPAYNGTFKVEIYDFDKPRYIPYVY